jgi:hypothetical protein
MQETSKRVFVEPRLRVYGDIARITQAVGPMGELDGGVGGTQKTMA